MRFKTEDLRAGLKAVAPAVAINPNAPHLAAVHLSATEGELTARATDYDTWITTRIAATQADVTEWSASVAHRLLTTIAGITRAKEIEIVPDGARCVAVAAGKAAWTLPTIDAAALSQWPAAPETIAEIDAEAFQSLVARVATAASTNTGYTPPLTVVEVAVRDGRLHLAATDRYRMHAEAAEATGAEPRVIYPQAERLTATAAALSGRITVGVAPSGETFSLADGRTAIQARAVSVDKWVKITERIAQWQGMIGARTIVPADDLTEALKAAAVTLPDGEGVRAQVSAGEFTIGSVDNDSGARSAIGLEDFEHTGRGIVSYFNPRVAVPTLALFGAQPVQIAWTGPKSAALVTQPGGEGVFALMPMARPDATWLEEESA